MYDNEIYDQKRCSNIDSDRTMRYIKQFNTTADEKSDQTDDMKEKEKGNEIMTYISVIIS
jgi:hypothetical protein